MASSTEAPSPSIRRTIRVLRRGRPAAPVALDLRTPSGRRLPV
jgi:hypothetical protein